MPSATFDRLLAAFLMVCLTNLGFVHSAGAAVIGTPALVQLEDRAAVVSRIQSSLAREDVRKAMVQLGVDPSQAQERVLALTDSEVAQLHQELAKLPAGGDGGWILLVIVLTVLVVLFATGKLRLN
jgi:hypothetical protein